MLPQSSTAEYDDKVGLAGIRIDLDFGDMAAIREGLRRIGLDLGVEAFRSISPLFFISLARSGKLEQRDLAVGADHFECAGAIADVALGGLE